MLEADRIMRRLLRTRKKYQAIWEARFRELLAFCKRHGHARVPVKYARNPRLGIWLSNQRQEQAQGRLLPKRRQTLRRAGVVFDMLEAQWNAGFGALMKFKRRQGHTRVPRQYGGPQNLGSWVARQRHLQHIGKLAEKYRRRLEQIAFDWNPVDVGWRRNYARLAEFKQVHGHCSVPSQTALGQWASVKRKRRRRGELDPEQVRQLDALGFDWVKPFVFGPQLEANWRKRVRDLKAFEQKHGHCQVPVRARARRGLGVWVGNVRQDYRAGKLREDRIRELNSLGFAWKPTNLSWEGHWAELAAFKRRHGHCRVPQQYAANPALGAFVANAREAWRSGTLSADQIRRLDSLGFGWAPMKSAWERRYAELVLFHQQHGHFRVPQRGLQSALGSFVVRLRKHRRLGRLSAQRIELLDRIGFVWQPVWGGSKPRAKKHLAR